MKKNLDTPILKLDGSTYADAPTLGSIVFAAIQLNLPTDQSLSVQQKMALYRLAQKIVSGGTVEFSAEELVLMKDRAGIALPLIIMGAVHDLLDSDSPENNKTHYLPIPAAALNS